MDRLLLDDLQAPGLQNLAVARDEIVGLLFGEKVVVVLTDDRLAGHAEQFLACPVQQDEPVIARVLHEQHGRDVLDHGIEKGSGAP